MQSMMRLFSQQALLLGTSRRFLPAASRMTQTRFFSAAAANLEVKQQEENQVDIDSRNQRLGVDTVFSQQKHAYVLTFPWNFQEIISDYERVSGIQKGSYWHRFVFNNATYDLNKLFREFHQGCALPDYGVIDMVCEPKLAQYVKESVRRIHFHGLDIEMANLTVEQPSMKLLKFELHNGVNVDRSKNRPASEYNIQKSTCMGATCNTYIPKNDTRSFLDHLDNTYKPYTIAATVLIESPMKLFVQNQNYSSVLFGSTDEENVKNVVRFETQVRALDLFRILGTSNKPQFSWKITDFNNILNENPYLPEY